MRKIFKIGDVITPLQNWCHGIGFTVTMGEKYIVLAVRSHGQSIELIDDTDTRDWWPPDYFEKI